MKNLIERLVPTEELIATIKRFPLSVLCALCIFVIIILTIHDLLDWKDDDTFRIVNTLGCLYFWFGIAKLITESSAFSRLKASLVTLIPAAGIIVLLSLSEIWGMHLLFVLPALLLTLMFAPYLKGGDDGSVWVFNRQVWLGVAISYLALILFAGGVSAAFYAIEKLFDLDIEHELYADIWSFAAFVLGPLYALSWVPKRFDFSSEEYSKLSGLKFIANWISVPMVFGYLLILYAYFIKMLITGEIPNGILAYLITGFAGAGVVTYLISWPMRKKGSAQLRLFHKIFFPALIIPVGFHFFAIWERIAAYGVTEQRYFILLSAIWFAMIAIGNLYRKMPIKAIPATLAILLVFASFGPWGAVSVSGQSQFSRLEKLLEKHDLLKDGKVQEAQSEIPYEDRLSISSIVNYLCDTQRHEAVYNLFERPEEEYKRYSCSAYTLIKEQLGFDFTYRSYNNNRDDHISIWGNGGRTAVWDIHQYDYFMTGGNIVKKEHKPCKEQSCPQKDADRIKVVFNAENSSLQFVHNDEIILEESIYDFVMDNKSLQNKDNPLYLEFENENIALRMVVISLYGVMKDDKPVINSFNYNLFYRFKGGRK